MQRDKPRWPSLEMAKKKKSWPQGRGLPPRKGKGVRTPSMLLKSRKNQKEMENPPLLPYKTRSQLKVPHLRGSERREVGFVVTPRIKESKGELLKCILDLDFFYL